MATAIKNCIIISDDGKIIKKKDICPYCGWSTTGSYVAYVRPPGNKTGNNSCAGCHKKFVVEWSEK